LGGRRGEKLIGTHIDRERMRADGRRDHFLKPCGVGGKTKGKNSETEV